MIMYVFFLHLINPVKRENVTTEYAVLDSARGLVYHLPLNSVLLLSRLGEHRFEISLEMLLDLETCLITMVENEFVYCDCFFFPPLVFAFSGSRARQIQRLRKI